MLRRTGDNLADIPTRPVRRSARTTTQRHSVSRPTPCRAARISGAGDDLDTVRPLIEYYRRHNKVDLLVPVTDAR